MRINWELKYSKKRSLVFNLSLFRKDKPRKDYITPKEIPMDRKVFCIGFAKTGTTSLEAVLKEFGYKLGNQPAAEMLCEDWYHKRSDRIINYCYTANAFQDIPFNMPGLYKELDSHFEGSKFILTVRKNEEVWFNSLIKFHSKIFAKDGKTQCTLEELKNAPYRHRGWALDTQQYFFDYQSTHLYDQEKYKSTYLNHIKDVENYFKDRPDDLLVLNVSEKGAYKRLAQFLNIEVEEGIDFPWLNKT
ncbi:MAG: hypothetical protein KDD41_07865 [Flavobacteriales bacterium]|nr:hypothetical protein [Flavobacteriales bacterium]